MRKEDLRKVIYSQLNPSQKGFNPDGNKEEHVLFEEQEGLFHEWTNGEKLSPTLNEYYIGKLGLIEDLETGKIMEIEPLNIKFLN